MTLFYRFSLLILALSAAISIQAQEYTIDQGGTITTCTGTLFDTGGRDNNHATSGRQQITICPDGTTGASLRVFVSSIDITGDFSVYNGQDATSPLLQTIDEDSDVETLTERATATNTSGCLTFVFEPRGSGSGWAASVSCVQACQTILPTIVSTDPPVTNVDGIDFIDVCPGDPITFTARADYPENGTIYDQSDATSEFRWSFQDGSTDEGTTVTHPFAEPGGYTVELQVVDRAGCQNELRIVQLVRVSAAPIYGEIEDGSGTVCPGEDLIVDIDGASGTVVFNEPTPQTFAFAETQTFSDLVLLPDERNILFRSPLEFTNFGSDQTLESGAGITRVCATIEHSFLGDLDIWLECPDETRLFLHRYDREDIVSRQQLGRGERETVTPDPPGLYCWTSEAPRTMVQVVEQDRIPEETPMPEIDYRPQDGPFSNLAGCPLNGEWSLNVIDYLEKDNGTIYNWSIEFSSSLFRSPITFSIPIVDKTLEDNGVYAFSSPTATTVNTDNPGPRQVRIITEDASSCTYDTTYVLQVASPFADGCTGCTDLPELMDQTVTICEGDSGSVDYSTAIPPDTLITWESVAYDAIGNAVFPDADGAYTNTITVADHRPAQVGSATNDIQSVCIEYDNTGDLADVTFELESPGGSRLLLIENTGGTGDVLTGTCFTPSSTTDIAGGSSPYTGEFAAAGGDWSVFDGVNTNGNWTLRAWDAAGNDVSRLIGWSISLRYDFGITYSWAPTTGGLSCTDCPNPTIVPDDDIMEYTLTLTTAAGCTREATVTVEASVLEVLTLLEQTNPACPGEETGSISIDVSDSGGALILAWEDDPTNGNITRTGLAAGTYVYTATDSLGCMQLLEVTLSTPDEITLIGTELVSVACTGESTGAINVMEVTGGSPGYTFQWDDPAGQTTASAVGLAAGTYNLVVTDAEGCSATFTETITEPEELLVDLTVVDVACQDGADGSVSTIVSGGTPPYTYAWSTGTEGEGLTGLLAGDYSLTVSDAANCTVVADFTVEEPPEPVTLSIAQDILGCAGTAMNVATVTATGGTPPYMFLWSNAETEPTATMLPGGDASVTVTDAGGCTQEISIFLDELPAVEAELDFTEPTCNDRDDATIRVTPSGGGGTEAADYTVMWNDGATTTTLSDLPAGRVYAVTVTDNRGCIAEAEAFIPVPPAITFASTSTRVACFGESNGGLTISDISGPNGGPYTVQWEPEAGGGSTLAVTGLPAGEYGLRVTDPTGCSIDTSLVITQPDTLQAATEVTDVSCNGEADGTLSAAGTGGTPPYAYAWSSGASDPEVSALPAGDYELTLTDANGCTTVTTYTVNEPLPLVATPMADSVLCLGGFSGQVDINASGGTEPYLYDFTGRGSSRSGVVLGLAAGTYGVTVTDANGCVATAPVTVEDGLEYSVEAGIDSTIIFGDSIRLDPVVSGGQGGVRYEWQPSAPTLARCGLLPMIDSIFCQRPFVYPQFETDFFLVAIDRNGCVAEDRVRISVRKIREVAVATGFSPNDDNRNDKLIVHGRPGTLVESFQVYDRWTNLLFEDGGFEVNDRDRGWDGTDKGGKLNAGVYFYKLVVIHDDFSRETLSGQTTLIR